jgi:Glucanosyltransferase
MYLPGPLAIPCCHLHPSLPFPHVLPFSYFSYHFYCIDHPSLQLMAPPNPDSSQMTPVFSGGLVYEWSQEPSDYGLVDLSNGNITLLQDYQNLKAEFAATPMPSGDGGYKASGSASTCPANGTDFTSWAVLPAQPEGAQSYIDNGAGKALGYGGPSNQGAGGGVCFLLLPLVLFCSPFPREME